MLNQIIKILQDEVIDKTEFAGERDKLGDVNNGNYWSGFANGIAFAIDTIKEGENV